MVANASMEADWKCLCGSHIDYTGWWDAEVKCKVCRRWWRVTHEGAVLLGAEINGMVLASFRGGVDGLTGFVAPGFAGEENDGGSPSVGKRFPVTGKGSSRHQ